MVDRIESAGRVAVSDVEAAGLLSIGRTKLRELVRDGEIRSLHVGRRLLIPVSEITAYLTRQIEQQGR
ncbi:MAG TPA: helix-turn-helix domain-containing protein [Dehalococcoidia bacterium]|nr:helix-turn-helix domain-containing protein [Dehalococcoidia bacterium]